MPEIEKKFYDIQDIMKVLPHRYPFLLVDRITEIGEMGGKGYKNLTMNEPFFQGHFPGAPIMPGVMMIEGMAQCAGFIALNIMKRKPEMKIDDDLLILFMTINNVKFRRPVVPGDKLEYDIQITKLKSTLGVFQGYARVDGEVACEAEMMAMWKKREEK